MGSEKPSFTLLVASTSDFTAMKFVVLILIVGLVSSRPKKDKTGKEDPSIIMRCLAENWKNEDGTEGINEEKIQQCRDCFKGVEGSNDALAEAKKCVSDWLPKEEEACTTELAALKSFEDEEKGKAVLECFDSALETLNNEECLNRASNPDTHEKLTDAAMCVIDSWKYGMDYVKKETIGKGGKGKGKGKRPRKGKKGGKKGMVMKLLTKAHCDLSSKGDDAKSSKCFNCFKAAVKKGRGKGKQDKMSPKMKSAISKCSEEYLSPQYDECNSLMKEDTMDKKKTHKCYMRVLINNEVKKCTDEKSISSATSDSLSLVMGCGKNNTIDWVKENASPKVAEKIVEFLEDDDDDDSHEDDDDMQG